MRCQCRIGKVDSVIAFDQLGEVLSILRVTPNVPSGVVVARDLVAETLSRLPLCECSYLAATGGSRGRKYLLR